MSGRLSILVFSVACGWTEPTPEPLTGAWSVDPSGVIEGSVDAGAVVTTEPLGFEVVATSGTFRIERLPPGDYVVHAALDGATGQALATVSPPMAEEAAAPAAAAAAAEPEVVSERKPKEEEEEAAAAKAKK